jgi:mRNA interferase HigB
MRIIAARTINAYRECYPDADGALKSWAALIKGHNFHHIAELKAIFPSADLIVDDLFVFNIKGNHYRLIAGIDFGRKVVFIKWFGKHKDYDNMNPSEVKHEYPPC